MPTSRFGLAHPWQVRRRGAVETMPGLRIALEDTFPALKSLSAGAAAKNTLVEQVAEASEQAQTSTSDQPAGLGPSEAGATKIASQTPGQENAWAENILQAASLQQYAGQPLGQPDQNIKQHRDTLHHLSSRARAGQALKQAAPWKYSSPRPRPTIPQGQPLQLEPDSIWFQVTLPEGQQHQDVRLRNTGVVTERFRLLPPATAHFTISQPAFPQEAGYLRPGLACSFRVSFWPDALRDYLDHILVEQPGGPGFSIPISARYHAPRLNLAPNWDLGPVHVGAMRGRQIYIRNSGGPGAFWWGPADLHARGVYAETEGSLNGNASRIPALHGPRGGNRSRKPFQAGSFLIFPTEFTLGTDEAVIMGVMFQPETAGHFTHVAAVNLPDGSQQLLELKGHGVTISFELLNTQGSRQLSPAAFPPGVDRPFPAAAADDPQQPLAAGRPVEMWMGDDRSDQVVECPFEVLPDWGELAPAATTRFSFTCRPTRPGRCAAVARLRLRLPDHVRAAQGADAWPPVTLALEACGVPGRLEITPSQLELPQPLHLGQVVCLPIEVLNPSNCPAQHLLCTSSHRDVRTRRANVVVLRNVLDVSAIQPADQSSDTSESASGPSEDLQPEHELGWLRFARSSGVLEPDARTTVQVECDGLGAACKGANICRVTIGECEKHMGNLPIGQQHTHHVQLSNHGALAADLKWHAPIASVGSCELAAEVEPAMASIPAGGNVEVVVRLMPLSIGKFEVLVPLGVDHSQEPIGLLLSGSVQGLQIRYHVIDRRGATRASVITEQCGPPEDPACFWDPDSVAGHVLGSRQPSQMIDFGEALLRGGMATARLELRNESSVGADVSCWLGTYGAAEEPTPLLPASPPPQPPVHQMRKSTPQARSSVMQKQGSIPQAGPIRLRAQEEQRSPFSSDAGRAMTAAKRIQAKALLLGREQGLAICLSPATFPLGPFSTRTVHLSCYAAQAGLFEDCLHLQVGNLPRQELRVRARVADDAVQIYGPGRQ
ncbi:hypothetical protein WJX84_005897 [Apatococcus fuscideae]|uniref:Deleted in lung and esophageal cancer protein 1 Ig-like domain-containing protein n=1 Tax=Apatococcus fuscideae TaxID=2026836 RepID=A0AAW1THM8_9CHLO